MRGYRSTISLVLTCAAAFIAACSGVERKKGDTTDVQGGVDEYQMECLEDRALDNTYIGMSKSPPTKSRWFHGPIILTLKQESSSNPYTVAEKNAMIAAGEKWNAYARAVYGQDFFDLRDLASANPPVEAPPTDETLCSRDIRLNSGVLADRISIYKVTGSWPSSLENVIGMTVTCNVSGESFINGMRGFSNAAMKLNFQYFWASGKKKPHLETIFIHELGHMLGLDHSCENNKVGYPNCASANPDYAKAVMNYQVKFDSAGNGVPNAVVDGNTQGRNNCVYKK